ncbi:MAG: DedA family protein [Candidatus Glassbacteria bacterium]|nr:DedA family protein [Candidatus Glassbacteria bacterium]
MAAVPPWLIYVLLMTTSALENIFPPFPGDTITVFGAYLAGRGMLAPLPVFLFTAAGNLGSNILLYYIGISRGREFIIRHKRLFHHDLLARVALFYRKWGQLAIFFSRFLVGLRSVVPLFAGVSRFKARKFIVPVACSIVVQHGLLVWLGYSLGRRWEFIKSLLREVNLGLGLAAAAVVVGIFFWFRSVRRHRAQRLARRNGNGTK